MEVLEQLSGFFREFWGLWLMFIFGGIVAWAYWPRNKDHLEEMGDIPFRDDKDEER